MARTGTIEDVEDLITNLTDLETGEYHDDELVAFIEEKEDVIEAWLEYLDHTYLEAPFPIEDILEVVKNFEIGNWDNLSPIIKNMMRDLAAMDWIERGRYD